MGGLDAGGRERGESKTGPAVPMTLTAAGRQSSFPPGDLVGMLLSLLCVQTTACRLSWETLVPLCLLFALKLSSSSFIWLPCFMLQFRLGFYPLRRWLYAGPWGQGSWCYSSMPLLWELMPFSQDAVWIFMTGFYEEFRLSKSVLCSLFQGKVEDGLRVAIFSLFIFPTFNTTCITVNSVSSSVFHLKNRIHSLFSA